MTKIKGFDRPYSFMIVYYDADDDHFQMDRPISNKRLLYWP